VLHKLGVDSRLKALVFALKHGLATINSSQDPQGPSAGGTTPQRASEGRLDSRGDVPFRRDRGSPSRQPVHDSNGYEGKGERDEAAAPPTERSSGAPGARHPGPLLLSPPGGSGPRPSCDSQPPTTTAPNSTERDVGRLILAASERQCPLHSGWGRSL
jgi:hypothetical protein